MGRRRPAVAAVVGDGDNLIFRLLEHPLAGPVLSDLPWCEPSLNSLHQPGIYVGLKTHVYMGRISPWHTHPHLYSTVHGAWLRHELTQQR